jgi:hypothetical protein
MAGTNVHAAAYCPWCDVKVKYQYPPGASELARDAAFRRELWVHYDAAGHARS